MSQSLVPETSAVHPCQASPVLSRQHICLAAVQPPGQQLPSKLCHYLRPKCHPLLLDATINSSSTVRLNIYQVCFSLHMPQTCRRLQSVGLRGLLTLPLHQVSICPGFTASGVTDTCSAVPPCSCACWQP